MIRKALADFLLAEPTITAVVGDRIRPLWFPGNGTFPAIVFRRINAGHNPVLEGGDNLPGPHFEITCWADTYGGAVDLNEIVRAALEDQGASDGSVTWGDDDVEVLSVTYIDEQDTFDENTEGGDKPKYGVQTVYEIIYRD